MRRRMMTAALVTVGLLAGCGGEVPVADGTESDNDADTSAAFCDRVGADEWADVLGDLADLGAVDEGAQTPAAADICTRTSTGDDDVVDRGVSVVYDTSDEAGSVEDVRRFLESANAGWRDVTIEGADDALVSDALTGGFPILVAEVGDGLLTIRNDASTSGQETVREDLGNAFVRLAEQVVIPGLGS